MIDVAKLRKDYPLAEIQDKKESLEKELSDLMIKGHSNIAQTSIDLNYYSQLHEYVAQLSSLLNRYEQAMEMKKMVEVEMREMANLELEDVETLVPPLLESITELQIERKFSDPDDMKSVILEIRAGAGGDEAALFAANLFGMYKGFASSKGWSVEIIDSNTTEGGGYKEVVAKIEGKNAYKFLKFESGVHRVQRIPSTESGGRIHTSTASVAILPEATAVDIQIDEADLRVDTMRASGAGGQHVNKTSSAIRITHLPTGIVVSCQDGRVQAQNKQKAMETLRTRLYDRKRQEEADKRSDMRNKQIGSAMRAEKIRTYNFPQSRITDHRIKVSWFDVDTILTGEIQGLLDTVNKEMLKLMLNED